MSDGIIDLSAERSRRAAPDSECVKRDDHGREMYLFLLSYDFDGGSWSTGIWTYSAEDAAARVVAMRESLRVDGQCFRKSQDRTFPMTDIEESMVERCARAMAESVGWPEGLWEEAGDNDSSKKAYRHYAKVAIAAMREVNMDMISAAANKAKTHGAGDFVAIWQAMLGAALGEQS